MHDPKRISDIAQAEPIDRDRKVRCSFDLPRLPFGRVNDAARVVISETPLQIVC